MALPATLLRRVHVLKGVVHLLDECLAQILGSLPVRKRRWLESVGQPQPRRDNLRGGRTGQLKPSDAVRQGVQQNSSQPLVEPEIIASCIRQQECCKSWYELR